MHKNTFNAYRMQMRFTRIVIFYSPLHRVNESIYIRLLILLRTLYIHTPHTCMAFYLSVHTLSIRITTRYIALSTQLVRFIPYYLSGCMGHLCFRKLYLLRRAVSILRFIETYPNVFFLGANHFSPQGIHPTC